MNVKSLPKVNQALATIAFIAALTLLANTLSQLVWQSASPGDTQALTFIDRPQVEEKRLYDLNLLKSHALFGVPPKRTAAPKAKAKPKKRVIPKKDLPKTTISLLGIIQFGGFYSAVIKSSGFEESYTIGEHIGHLIILRIGVDFVVFDDHGDEVTVHLDQGDVTLGGNPPQANESAVDDSVTLSQAQPAPRPISRKNIPTPDETEATVVNITPQQKEKLRVFKKTLANNPLEMLGKVKTNPYRQNGEIAGFQVYPGSERALFTALKLRPGDIITQINGQPLNQISNFTDGMKLMTSLSQGSVLDMVISRRGSEERIFVELE